MSKIIIFNYGFCLMEVVMAMDWNQITLNLGHAEELRATLEAIQKSGSQANLKKLEEVLQKMLQEQFNLVSSKNKIKSELCVMQKIVKQTLDSQVNDQIIIHLQNQIEKIRAIYEKKFPKIEEAEAALKQNGPQQLSEDDIQMLINASKENPPYPNEGDVERWINSGINPSYWLGPEVTQQMEFGQEQKFPNGISLLEFLWDYSRRFSTSPFKLLLFAGADDSSLETFEVGCDYVRNLVRIRDKAFEQLQIQHRAKLIGKLQEAMKSNPNAELELIASYADLTLEESVKDPMFCRELINQCHILEKEEDDKISSLRK